MSPSNSHEFTALLDEYRAGDRTAGERLVAIVYQELRRLAQYYLRNERPGHTLQATALVHEAYLRLFGSEVCEWRNRAHFFAVAARQMRRLLVDHARAVNAEKRHGARIIVPLEEVTGKAPERDEDIVAMDEALTRLEQVSSRAGQVVELRFFGGLTETEAAETLGISTATLKRDWDFAKAWLYRQLRETAPSS